MGELTPEQIKALQEENATLKSEVKEKDNALNSAIEVSDEQSALIEKLKGSSPTYKPTIKVDKKTIRINHGITDEKGVVHTIASLEKNPALIKALLKSESTAVTQLTED